MLQFLVVFLFITTLLLAYMLYRLRVSLRQYETEVRGLISLAEEKDNQRVDDFDLRLQIEVKDPLNVAKRESGLARVAAGPAPHVVKRKCYEEVARQTIDQFKKKDVEVEIKVIVI